MGGESKLAGIAAMITAIVGLLTFYYSVFLPSQKPPLPTTPTQTTPLPTTPPAIPTQYSFVSWESVGYGKGDGQLYYPGAVAVDPKIGNVYVADQDNSPLPYNYIKKFTADGTFITKWGSWGKGDGQFDNVVSLGVDLQGNVYVGDSHRIQKFDSNGNFITKWVDGQFFHPLSISIDFQGNVYVADYGNNIIQKFDSNGNFITELESWNEHIAVNSSGNIYGVETRRTPSIQVFVPKT